MTLWWLYVTCSFILYWPASVLSLLFYFICVKAGFSYDRRSPPLYVRDLQLLPEWTHVHIWRLRWKWPDQPGKTVNWLTLHNTYKWFSSHKQHRKTHDMVIFNTDACVACIVMVWTHMDADAFSNFLNALGAARSRRISSHTQEMKFIHWNENRHNASVFTHRKVTA